MKEKIEQYKAAFKEVDKYLDTLPSIPDAGTCNMDTVAVDFSGWRQSSIDKITFRIGRQMAGLWKGYRLVYFNTPGQGNLRNMFVEKANSKLKELGIPSVIFYQMD